MKSRQVMSDLKPLIEVIAVELTAAVAMSLAEAVLRPDVVLLPVALPTADGKLAAAVAKRLRALP